MKPVSIDEFCAFTFLSGVKFSPDGKTVVFAASRADQEANLYRSNLYMKKGSKVVQLTAGNQERSFVFLDSKTVLFAADREEDKKADLKSSYYSISLDGGEAKKYVTFPIPVRNVIPLKNGDMILEGKTFPGYEDLYTGNEKLADAYLAEEAENEDYQVITQNPWWWNGSTYFKGQYYSLFYYTRKTGKLTRLTETGEEVTMAKVDPAQKYVYYFKQKIKSLQKPSDMLEEMTLYRTDLSSGDTQEVFVGSPEFFAFDYDFGESFILLAAVRRTHGQNTNPDFFKIDYDTCQVTEYAKWGEAIGGSVGSDIRYGGGTFLKMDGDTCYFIGTVFDSAYLYQLKDGVFTKLTEKEGSVECFDVKNGKIIQCALWDMKGQELYDETGKQLTKLNAAVLKNKYVAIPEKFTFETAGHELHGFVLKPYQYDESRTYPVIFDIHGGPKTVYGEVYYHEMQFWAGRGYFVIFCNPTGSDGRGNDFMDIRGKYGTVDYEDLMAFADEALRRYPQMDKDRMYETGGSYGGFMTNWIIGHTDRFRACASQRSISNWFSFSGIADIGVDFAIDQCAADIWENPEKMWWHSPLKYADQVKTPTLFIHSDEDYRCPIDQAYQMFTALLQHGVEAKIVQFKGENHDLSRTGKPKHRIRRLKEITNWFETH